MKKSEGITKYEVQWQILRASIKGSGTSLEEKLLRVREYYGETLTFDRWERCYNWLEGMINGYKSKADPLALRRLDEEAFFYKRSNPTHLEDYSLCKKSQMEIVKSASEDSVCILWKDLFRTNRRWLEKGYYHKECNEFMDWLYKSRPEIASKVNYKYSTSWLTSLREFSSKIDNSHKFFF